jgi:CheY-specific phosphatase CheX
MTNMTILISDDDLERIAEEICLSLFEEDDANSINPACLDVTRIMTAIVDINGDWNGSVSVRCQRAIAERIAAVMFQSPAPDLTQEDVVDALGEFANMAAGAVKGMLEGEKYLGLPTVGEGSDYTMTVAHTREVLGIDYPLADGSLRLAVHELRRAD